MTKQTILSSNLSKLRASLKMSQEQFANTLRKETDGNIDLSPITISAYESGERVPPTINLYWIARVFRVSVDALLGLSADGDITGVVPERKDNNTPIPVVPDYGLKIRVKDLEKYDRQPVYVKSTDKEFRDGWAIVSLKRRTLVFSDFQCSFSSHLEYYNYPPKDAEYISAKGLAPLTYSALVNNSIVWVEMLSGDGYIKGQYNGWYVHNENHTALINKANGLVLPYAGIGVSYNAFLPRNV